MTTTPDGLGEAVVWMAGLSTMEAFTRLAFTRPARDASAGVVAAWYDRKAAVLDQIAAEAAPRSVSECDTYQACARKAHAHAVRLRAGGAAA
jgi:hypothetical protein